MYGKLFAMKNRLPLLFATILLMSGVLHAQTEPVVLKQPKATMPKDSDTVGIYGDIAIRVMVDKSGEVRSAELVEGPGDACPTVTNRVIIDAREAAKAAALKARFKPDGTLTEPVSTILKYPFIIATPASPASTVPPMRLMLEKQNGIVVFDNKPAAESAVLNGKALTLPAPPYPRAARSFKAAGPVEVLVIIDVDGTMLSARAVSGHPMLQGSARIAACQATFTPTLLEGKPVKVTGLITYNFNL